MNPIELAVQWRAENGYTGKGGVVVIFEDVVNSWVDVLRDPNHWAPGCVAVDESGSRWVAIGGSRQRGSERWEPVSSINSE